MNRFVLPAFLCLSLTVCLAEEASATGVAATAKTTWTEAADTKEAPAEKPTFSVMVYNVENLFDADDIAIYEDYNPAGKNPAPYSPAKVLTKVKNVARNVQQLNDGKGPDIIMFQEFEQDRSNGNQVVDYAAFLEKYQDTTVDEMLTSGFNAEIADISSDALVLKYFEDNGLTGYQPIVGFAPVESDDGKAQNNVIFTRFPVLSASVVPTHNARHIQVVTVDVHGSPLTLINNHWKSGASSWKTENDRVMNAADARAILDDILEEDPYADVIIAGDLNTYYNAAEYFPTQGWERDNYAIAVLGSQGDELAIRETDGPELYNLWFELPKEKRGSEVYHGSWGTLIQMLITRGLYDQHGITYQDGSFHVVIAPGANVDKDTGAPIAWHFLGDNGGGFSDHLPVTAVFVAGGEGEPGDYVDLENPSRDAAAPAWVRTIDYTLAPDVRLPSASTLAGLDDNAIASHFGEIYEVSAKVVDRKPLTVRVGNRDFEVYGYQGEIQEALQKVSKGQTLHFYGQLDEYQGKPQFVVHDPSWLK